DLNQVSVDDCWIHAKTDRIKASILSKFFDYTIQRGCLPRPFGVFYQEDRPAYEEVLENQIKRFSREPANLDELLSGSNYWEVN
ncbi:MAG: 2-oxoacid:ferredoxin oxidoreductase subunit beta, partial [Cyclobacteriaceae bacterium]